MISSTASSESIAVSTVLHLLPDQRYLSMYFLLTSINFDNLILFHQNKILNSLIQLKSETFLMTGKHTNKNHSA